MLGCQSGPTSDERLDFFKRNGVDNICGWPDDYRSLKHYTVEDLSKLRDRCEKHGVNLDMVGAPFLTSSHIDRERVREILTTQPVRHRFCFQDHAVSFWVHALSVGGPPLFVISHLTRRPSECRRQKKPPPAYGRRGGSRAGVGGRGPARCPRATPDLSAEVIPSECGSGRGPLPCLWVLCPTTAGLQRQALTRLGRPVLVVRVHLSVITPPPGSGERALDRQSPSRFLRSLPPSGEGSGPTWSTRSSSC